MKRDGKPPTVIVRVRIGTLVVETEIPGPLVLMQPKETGK